MSSTSAIVLPWNLTARTSALNLAPPQASQVIQTSGRKCISIRFWPAPSQVSHRPPAMLKLNRRDVYPRTLASGSLAYSSRIRSNTPE